MFLFVNYCFGFELFVQVSFMSAGSELTWRNLWQAFVQLFLIAIWYPVHQAFLPISRAHRVPDAVAALLWCQGLKIAAHHLTNSTIDCCILISRIPSRGSPLSHDIYIAIRREGFLKAIDDVQSDQFSRAVIPFACQCTLVIRPYYSILPQRLSELRNIKSGCIRIVLRRFYWELRGVQFGKMEQLKIGIVTNLFKGFCYISFAAKTMLLFFSISTHKGILQWEGLNVLMRNGVNRWGKLLDRRWVKFYPRLLMI